MWREALPAKEEKYRMFVQNQAAAFDTKGNMDVVVNRLLQEREQRLNESESLFMEIFG